MGALKRRPIPWANEGRQNPQSDGVGTVSVLGEPRLGRHGLSFQSEKSFSEPHFAHPGSGDDRLVCCEVSGVTMVEKDQD